MGKKRSFTKEFKLEIVRESETKPAAEICREHNLQPQLLHRWKKEHDSNPKEAFSGKGKIWKEDAKLAEAERLIGQLYAENTFLKKVLERLQQLRTEEKRTR